MRLTETINPIYALEEISFDGVIYLVNIKTNKPGNHYISGFHSEVQARKYQSFLNGLDFDKSFVIVTTTKEVAHHLTVSCIITTIIPVNEYIIQKTDALYSLNPELTSKDLLVLVNDLLAPKQVDRIDEDFTKWLTENYDYSGEGIDNQKYWLSKSVSDFNIYSETQLKKEFSELGKFVENPTKAW